MTNDHRTIEPVRIPWATPWTGEIGTTDEWRTETRPCRYADGKPAVWMAHKPGSGKPVFSGLHAVRLRKALAEWRCLVCGERTQQSDRWLLVTRTGGSIARWEIAPDEQSILKLNPPVHEACGRYSVEHCPHLRANSATLHRLPDVPFIIGRTAEVRSGRTVVAGGWFGLSASTAYSLFGRENLPSRSDPDDGTNAWLL